MPILIASSFSSGEFGKLGSQAGTPLWLIDPLSPPPAGQTTSPSWLIQSVPPSQEKNVDLRRGTGYLLDFSDDLVVYRQADSIHIEALGGDARGSFRVPRERPRWPGDTDYCSTDVRFAGLDRILIVGCGGPRIVDFHGHKRFGAKLPRDRIRRYKLSADGKRLLVGTENDGMSVWDKAIIAASMMPIPFMDTAEELRVLSGDYVALGADGLLKVFPVSQTCR